MSGLGEVVAPASFRAPRLLVESAWLEHAPFGSWLVEALRPRVVVELGTHNGFSYFVFCQAVQEAGLDTRLVAVDHWRGDDQAGFYGGEVYRAVREHNDRHYARLSQLIRAPFDEAVHAFADGGIDLLHLDGRHTYDDVRRDYETWMPKLSNRAVVLFHDTQERERDFGVHRLWAEVARERPSFEFVHGHGLGVLAFGDDPPEPIVRFLRAVADPAVARATREAYARLGRTVTLEARAAGFDDRAGAPLVHRAVEGWQWLRRLVVGGPVRAPR